MTTITIERALLEQAYAMLSSNKTHIRVVMSRDETCVAIRAALSAPATAPSHTEAEVQELLHDDREMTEERFEISVRRILGVPAP